MTSKEEYENFVLRYKGCGACFPKYHTLSRFEKMWFTAIQKDVAELERKLEQAEKDLLDYQFNYPTIKELQKENAELKSIKDVAALIRANNDTVVTLMQLNNQLVSKNQQLTKAKSLLAKWVDLYNPKIEGFPKTPIQVDTEKFLKESE